ncbi:MAG: hypothetical protein K6B42_02955 [Clostridia bacterium]|nr:hypothetical protein [Clostridia bacterium]
MKYYLLDYENVNTAGLDGLGELPADSKIILFYTRNSNKIDLGVVNQLRDMKAELSIVEVHHGKQALDIQLASYLGYLIGTEPADTEYFIISKDKGYRNVQCFWPDRHIVLCKNLTPDSEIVDEPAEEKKPASRSGSRSRRKSSPAKASKPVEKKEAVEKPVEIVEPEVELKAEPAKEKPAEEPKPNAFVEAAAIAKAVVEAKKARNEAEAKAEKKKTTKSSKTTKSTKAEKTTKETKTKKTAKPKQRISDIRAEVNNQIQRVLSKENFPGEVVNSTASFVSKNVGKEGYKQTVYRGIIKENGQKQGLAIYRLIKDII